MHPLPKGVGRSLAQSHCGAWHLSHIRSLTCGISNIWTANSDDNKDLTVHIGNHYGLSRRLTSLMARSRKKPAATQPKVSVLRKSNDVEQGIRLNRVSRHGTSAKNASAATAALGDDGQDFFMKMRSTVNYSDIDLTPKGECRKAQPGNCKLT